MVSDTLWAHVFMIREDAVLYELFAVGIAWRVGIRAPVGTPKVALVDHL